MMKFHPPITTPAILSSALRDFSRSGEILSAPATASQPALGSIINWENIIPLAHNDVMSVVNAPIEQELVDHFVIEEGCYGLQFVLSGNHAQILDDNECYSHAGPRMNITHFREKTSQVRVHQAGTKLTYVGAWVSPHVLKHVFGINPGDIDRILHQRGNDQPHNSMDFPLLPKAQQLVAEMFAANYEGKIRRVFMRSKMDELLCLALSDVADGLREHQYSGDRLTNSKTRSLEKLKDYVQANYQDLPPIESMCSMVNMSRTNLCNSFRSRYGMVLSDYIQSVKMDNAKRLLMSGAYTILQVANEVGYSNQSSFTRVYKRHFNRMPKEDKMLGG
ncbi:helix-turn-helix transcriptional regulator [Pseudomaricurvus alkylphenolicus]|uniref:helix-turn-helix domain-containing protein n=1 Tax=Pseudomaricurvus alkylphenolicus TaxID=1306991 RepID=UPI0014206B96|nr:AraC family transcriptional regulator [Pseudomaricurvus alkylphenolicus]NIB42661.1 helix-turn-helix transcriptional regulator [Pseudomaricurvus alkylphenolicus]